MILDYFWIILAAAPDPRKIHDFPRFGKLLQNIGFHKEKTLFFHVLRAFAYPSPRAWFLTPRNLEGFGTSDVLFIENARKMRFRPPNPLLEWFRARLRVSNAH